MQGDARTAPTGARDEGLSGGKKNVSNARKAQPMGSGVFVRRKKYGHAASALANLQSIRRDMVK
jgi:hypothetical protein